MLDTLSTKIRPKKNYKTNRKDLDGSGVWDLYFANYTGQLIITKKGKGVDIHKMIGKIAKPKGGWTPGDYKYLGPYNPLDKQLKYDPETGEILSWYVQPKHKVDEIAAHHDICYDR